MICNECYTTIKAGETSCYRCGWKIPAPRTPDGPTEQIRVRPMPGRQSNPFMEEVREAFRKSRGGAVIAETEQREPGADDK